MKDGFTYEFDERQSKLETYEWERIWWEHIDDLTKDRVLIIGDSISCGYRDIVNEMLQGDIYADGLGTSKAADNQAFPVLIDYMRCQFRDYKTILFNNGLHGWHLSNEEYEKYYGKLLEYVKKSFPDAKIKVVLTTPVRKRDNVSEFDERNQIVIERNRIAVKIAENLGAEILDLYTILLERTELYRNDGVHLLDKGYELLADKFREMLTKQDI